jgi:hypothetical protein
MELGLDGFSKNTPISNFMKICPVGAEFFHTDGQTDGQTDMTNLIVALRNFAKVPQNISNKVVETEEGHVLRPLHSFRKFDPFKINEIKSRNGAACVHFFIYWYF